MSGDDMGKTSRWQGFAPWADSKLRTRYLNGKRQGPRPQVFDPRICYRCSSDAIHDSKLVFTSQGPSSHVKMRRTTWGPRAAR
jgi:hypothetical protein